MSRPVPASRGAGPDSRRRALRWPGTGHVLLFLAACLLVAAVQPRAGHAEEQPWLVELKTKFMFNSRTSYEFGNPYPPYQTPLSRLEFPMDSVWAGVGMRRQLGRVSVGLEYLTTVGDQYSGRMQDSDWDDDRQPDRLSIYSSSQNRMRPSFQLSPDMDVQVADLLRLPAECDVRPVVGYRWQKLSFTTHDGTQFDYGPSGETLGSIPLPGDGIDFDQNWHQFFLGLRLGYTWTKPPLLHHVRFSSQGDWSYVIGNNEDHHLFRGDRFTRDDTRGNALHGMLGVSLGVTEHLDVGVEAEYMRIATTGTHTLTVDSLGIDTSFDHGVSAWSEQSSVSVKLDYKF